MTDARLLSIVVLLAYGFLLQPPIAAADGEVKDLLNEAHSRYEKQLREVEREAVAKLDALIDRYSDEGNLQKVLELRAERTRLLEDRAWPEAIGLRSVREKIKSTRVRAKRELANAYEDAIAELTKERRYDDAVALRDELDELKKIQAEFDFRSAEPGQKKPLKAADERQSQRQVPEPPQTAPERQSEPPAMPAKSAENKPALADVRQPATPAMPAKSAESERATKDEQLAAILAKDAGSSFLDDPLSTSEEKKKGLSQFVEKVYAELPPRLWTPRQYDEFVAFFVAAAAKAGGYGLPPLPPVFSGEGLGGGFSIESVKKMAGECHGPRWLLSSPTLDEFISRAIHLQANEHWPAINKLTSADRLKTWLRSVGCTDVESYSAFLRKTKEAGVRLAALEAMRAELGE